MSVEMKTLFLAWQDPKKRDWFPIGRLTFNTSKFSFVYTKGAYEASKNNGFQPLVSFPDFHKLYQSDALFPLFANRVMPRSRPDYASYLESLNIPKEADDPITILSKSGGKKATDYFEIFPCPKPDENGLYHIHFFLHGLRYSSASAIECVNNLKHLDPLYLMHDIQNSFDPKALALRTDASDFLGYCPRYLASDIHEILKDDPKLANVSVERVNPAPTPIQMRLLCSMTAKWPENFHPFSSDQYQPIIEPVRI